MTKKFEDIINEQGQLVYTNVGDSMYPLIKPRDLLVIKKVTAPLKKNDIPLYKRDSGQYVLHRIVKIKNGEYYICGDNRAFIERGITDRHIIGVLTDIVREGRTIPVNSPEFKSYVKLLPLRRSIIRIKNKGGLLIKHLKP
ncbi:S24/S26 family peptidase [Ruminococcus sp. JL13D9]|jgi:phage repressor protein C with HTH and peptisase S24 domain|uniref:S24/S26 family peptidase n=1 Tax=Ruminococcus sp. JL13D9 TaxID=3233381 RepID=UPI00389AF534|nr:S24/S26 family peptidase [Ruminococcus sp.]